ncbi:hypothetical protein B0H15DRAFT_276739 [Mycena belliarum]|uniref:Smr domain-containing protein n=1 Tax=Mycena belliarum TaxID=1033014 RepID=A0AAD6XN06_9AGAR|nr:hypothetical protein B0H15DRAFT_276739 [Mycena belliae]
MNMDAIFETLQAEFCPPLDTSLLAALLADLDLDAGPSDAAAHPQLAALRSTLLELALHADEDAWLAEDDPYPNSYSDDTPSDFCATTATTTTTSVSELPPAGAEALAFLHAALPHVPRARLAAALTTGADEPDMWDVLCTLLSEDTARELAERDLDELPAPLAADEPWAPVPVKKKRKAARAQTIALTDVRQQQHAVPRGANGAGAARAAPLEDPWTHLASLAEHLSALLPPHAPALFLSFFHAPDRRTPYDALCGALAAVSSPSPSSASTPSSTTSSSSSSTEPDDLDAAALLPLLDALLPAHPALPLPTLLADAERALRAARGRPADAFELVRVLRALDDGALGGVYHSPAVSPLNSPSLNFPSASRGPCFSSAFPFASPSSRTALPTGPAPTPPPPALKPPPAPAAPERGGWQPVPTRRRRTLPSGHTQELAAHIPAYQHNVNGVRVRDARGRLLPSAANGYAVGGGGYAAGGGREADVHRRRARESLRRRDELLREAARMWQRGRGGGGRGGEVAFYFAERAREFQEVARKEALDAARAMVSAKRTGDTVDLHGVTAAEAIVLVDEILAEGGWGGGKPLKIITGRGAHSAGGTSVLKPALRRALEASGWIVGAWDGGLSVRGRRVG